MSIGTALIGCGKVGDAHARAFNSLPESHFVAVYDPIAARAEVFAQRYGVQGYGDLDALLANRAVQMVSICTPHHTHAELIQACARAGVNVLVEKPLAVDLQGCDQAIAAAERAGIRLGVISQRRLYEPVQRVKKAIEDGKIGTPIVGTLTVMGWRDEAYYQMDPWRGKWAMEGGGVMVNQTAHQIDLFQWLMGPVVELYGGWDNFNHPYIEVEDTAAAFLRFKNGAFGALLLSNSQKPGFYGKIHVHGSNGASVGVQTDGGSPFISGVTAAADPPFNDVWTVPGEEHLLAQWQAEDRARGATLDVMTHYHQLQIQDFLQAMMFNRAPAVTAHEARKAVEIFTAIYRCERDRMPIRFPLDAMIGSDQFDGRLAQRP